MKQQVIKPIPPLDYSIKELWNNAKVMIAPNGEPWSKTEVFTSESERKEAEKEQRDGKLESGGTSQKEQEPKHT